jgi:hypothetical protein
MKKVIFTVFFLFVMVGMAYAQTQVSTATSQGITTGVVICSSAAQQIVPVGGRVSLGMVNHNASTDTSGNTVYIGRSNVTVATGVPIYAKSALVLDRTRAAIYCISSGAELIAVRYWYE